MAASSSSNTPPPILSHRDDLLEALRKHPCIIVQGDTGSGKTTQLPRFLVDSGHRRVVVTQPRRVAAIAAARRVADEMGCSVGDAVGYAVRFERKCSESTHITFATDGVLLRQAVSHPELEQYDALILDEAHERSLNTDVLFALAKRVLAKRWAEHAESANEEYADRVEPPRGLRRVIVASATLDAVRLRSYFFDAPIFRVAGRCFPVTIRHTAEPAASHSLVESALELVLRLHSERPLDTSSNGGGQQQEEQGTPWQEDVLIFCTGADEIATAAHALRELVRELQEDDRTTMLVLPLHASLPPDEQARVFSPAPRGCRKVILATNVAETSLTIPGVSIIVDLGLVKEKRFDASRGLEMLTVVPISQSAATQRAGRAGRTAPGEVYRLYTEAQLAQMDSEPQPEIARTNLANAVLQLKGMGLTRLHSFDWLDPPDPTSLHQAVRQLFLLGALDRDGNLTQNGRAMAKLPIEPCLARTLLSAIGNDCLDAAAVMCAMASGEDPFCRAGRAELLERAAATRERLDGPEGDHVSLLRLFREWLDVEPPHARDDWCMAHGVRGRVLRTAHDVHQQLVGLLKSAGLHHHREQGSGPPRAAESESVRCRKSLADGYFFQAAKRMRGTAVYQTLSQPPQTVALHAHLPTSNKHGSDGPNGSIGGVIAALSGGSRRLAGAEYVVFSELTWAGRAVMHRACAVDWGWIEPLLPRLDQVDVNRLLGVEEGTRAEGDDGAEAEEPPTDGSAGPQPGEKRGDEGAARRNGDEAVSDARARFLARKAARH